MDLVILLVAAGLIGLLFYKPRIKVDRSMLDTMTRPGNWQQKAQPPAPPAPEQAKAE
jgi:hypothetical protein